MALTTSCLRLRHHLRRALSLSSSYLHHATTSTTNSQNKNPIFSPFGKTLLTPRMLHYTHPSLVNPKSFNDVEKIDPDTILFEGCDYKHWLIVMDFGKDPEQRPSPEQMVETYVQTLAKVLGSVEEAKKKIYACSTTTYTGFQAEIDEETSQKLEGLPGVVFVLPDSYIDPVNKEYGGDKYINGTIIPRPPPVQYGRMNRDRRNDQRSRAPMNNQQGNQPYNQHGSMSGEGRGYMPQRQNFPGNNAPTDGGRSNPMSNRTNYSNEGRDYHQSGGNTHSPPQQGNYNQGIPSHQGNYNQGVPSREGNYNQGMPSHQGNYNQGYTQPHRMENSGDRGSYAPYGQVNNRQGDHGYNHSQGQMRNFPENHGGYTPQGQTNYPGRNYAPAPPARGADGQTGVGSFEQNGPGRYEQGSSGTYSEAATVGYGPGYTSQVRDQRFSQGPNHPNPGTSEHSNYPPADQTGINQRRV